LPGYIVTPKFSTVPDGEEVEVPGLGLLKNNKDNEISPEQADAFRSWNRVSKDVPDAESPDRRTEYEDGPTVLEFFKGNPLVTVKTSKDDSGEKKKEANT
jgi:hypothetical protein